LTINNDVNQLFDTVVVATTATVSQLIDFDFEPRMNSSEKSSAMQELMYECAIKILLSFNLSWWYTQENITRGFLVTDFLLRTIYYPSPNISQIDGGTILTSYIFFFQE